MFLARSSNSTAHSSSDSINLSALWKKTLKSFTEGTVIATLGTDSLTPAEEKEFGLVGDHNYSIFEMVEIHSLDEHNSLKRGSHKLVKVRNPWSKGGVPGDSFSTFELRNALSDHDITPSDPITPIDNISEDNISKSVTSESLSPASASLGTFWLPYSTLTQHFKTLYLNWNPALFPYISRKHFSFTPNGSDFDVAGNGQFTIKVEGTGDMWILIERHCLGKGEGWEGYIGLAVFEGEGRIYCYERAVWRVLSPLKLHFL